MGKEIKNRHEIVLLFDVKNGNPNGDPDAGNLPRIDPETGHGIVTDVCLKRKIQNYVELIKKGETPFNIYVQEKAILTERRLPAYEAVADEKDMPKKINKARKWMCRWTYRMCLRALIESPSRCSKVPPCWRRRRRPQSS